MPRGMSEHGGHAAFDRGISRRSARELEKDRHANFDRALQPTNGIREPETPAVMGCRYDFFFMTMSSSRFSPSASLTVA